MIFWKNSDKHDSIMPFIEALLRDRDRPLIVSFLDRKIEEAEPLDLDSQAEPRNQNKIKN
jgi:hypothetical protein